MELDASSATEFASAMVGVDFDTKGMSVDKAKETEKQKVTENFFAGIQNDEAPGVYYAPLVDETSGYVNYREGMGEFPNMWQPSKTRIINARRQVEVISAPKASSKPILKPKSRKALKHDIHMPDYDSTARLSRTILSPPSREVAYTDTLIKGVYKSAVCCISLLTIVLFRRPQAHCCQQAYRSRVFPHQSNTISGRG